MGENDSNIQPKSSGWDLLGLGQVGQALLGPIERGVGRLVRPFNMRRENSAHIDNFRRWDEALNTFGYAGKTVELTVGEQTQVRVLAENIGKQENRLQIAGHAVEQGGLEGPSDDDRKAIAPPDDDWLDQFWRLAENVNNADMQAFFGKILARRCLGKASFSARALAFLPTLSEDEAAAIEHLAKRFIRFRPDRDNVVYAVLHALDGRFHRAADEKDQPLYDAYQREFQDAIGDCYENMFQPLGLYLEATFSFSMRPHTDDGFIRFSVGNQEFVCDARNVEFRKNFPTAELGLVYYLSPLAIELFVMLNLAPDPDFEKCLVAGFRLRGLELKRVEQVV